MKTKIIEFQSIEEAYEYVDKMGYLYAIKENCHLKSDPIKQPNGNWSVEIEYWNTSEKEKMTK